MNILLVDDDMVDRQCIKRALRGPEANHNVIDVDNAETALGILNDSLFDVILLDYLMPKVNGIEFVVKLKSLPASKHSAIVMISNSTCEDIVLECINAGAQDFLLKQEVNPMRISRALLQAKKRFELEQALYESYLKVKDMAEHDSLTGLYNRYLFEESLSKSVESSVRLNTYVAVLILDLDHFKNINDSFGHDIGDNLLIQVAKRIQTKLRAGEVFARLGGDEFGLVIDNISYMHQVQLVADRILSVFQYPFLIDNHEVHCFGSMGIAISPMNGNKGEELVKFADIAMYRAKALGRNQSCIFQDNMQREFYRKYMLEQELRKAVKAGEFSLFYQPIVDCESEEVRGLEALIRWPSASVATFPDEFIPIAEESHIIEELGEWVLLNAVDCLARLRQQLGTEIYLSINLSALQLQDHGVCELLKLILDKYKVPTWAVMLEITETALVSDNTETKDALECFHEMGCRIALDDFGTGYSSVSHLLNYPIDVVKLHKSLIDGSTKNQRHYKIMVGLCSMLNDLSIDVVAEGIEDKRQLALCKQCGVKLLQGYLFAKPMEESAVKSYLTQH